MRRAVSWTAATLAFAAAGAWALPPTGNSYWSTAPAAPAPAKTWSQGGALNGRGLGGIRAGGLKISGGDNYELDIFGRVQEAGYAENVSPTGASGSNVRANHNRVYLFLKQARLGFYGHFGNDVRYESQFAYGPEEASPYASTSNNPMLTLLTMDANVATPFLGQNSSIKAGQFRLPFSRQGLTNLGYTPFLDRGLSNQAFGFGRDVGIAYENDGGQSQRWVGTLGTFTGAGADAPNTNPPHLLGENLGIPMVVARLGYNDGIDEDVYHVSQDDLQIEKTEKAAYVNGLFMKDTGIAHDTVLALNSSYPRPLLLDPDFNPYLKEELNSGGPASLQAGDLWMMETDEAYRTPLGDGNLAFLSRIEADYGGYNNSLGSLHIAGGAANAGILDKSGPLGRPLEIMFRYSLLAPDKNIGYTFVAPGAPAQYQLGSTVMNEVTPSLTWFLHGENLKLVADVPVYFNMPVYTSTNFGSEVFADFPDSITNQANSMKRETVTEARMMLQLLF